MGLSLDLVGFAVTAAAAMVLWSQAPGIAAGTLPQVASAGKTRRTAISSGFPVRKGLSSEPVVEDDAESESAEDQAADSDIDEEVETVVPISYEGIPSWEEAISYLQRRPRESRSRDGSRGRGPQRR